MWRQKQKDGTTQLVGALTLGGIINALYPVNSVLMTTDNVNPGTRFTGTTWVAFGAGRALVGVGSNGTNTYTSEQTFGADAITLVGAQSGVNAHTHNSSGILVNGASADHTHNMSVLSKSLNPGTTSSDNAGAKVVQGSPSGAFNATQSGVTAGFSANHQHVLPADIGPITGASDATAHENRQCSIAVYAWKRTV